MRIVLRRLALSAAALVFTACPPASTDDSTSSSGASGDSAPAAPSNVVVSVMGGGLHVTWMDNSSNETEFVVERKRAGGVFGEVARTTSNTAQYHDEGVTPGVVFTYRVAASNAKGLSEYSAEAFGQVPLTGSSSSLAGSSGTSTASSGIASSGTAASSSTSTQASSAPEASSVGGGSSAEASSAMSAVDSSSLGTASSAISTMGQPPTCTITAPADNTVSDYDAMWMFTATATDAEDGNLTGASVVWTSSLASTPLGTGTMLTRVLPNRGQQVITCTVQDSDGNTGTDSITVTARSPVAAIWHPTPTDGPRRSSMPVPFTGRGRSAVDGTLTGTALVWTSSIDGPIGTGESFNASLSPGMHVITLTVTDSTGATGVATLNVEMTNN